MIMWKILTDLINYTIDRWECDFRCYLRIEGLWTDTYTYSPLFTLLFSPFNYLSTLIGEIIWFGISLVFLKITYRMFKEEKIPWVLFVVYLFSIRDGNIDFLLVPLLIYLSKQKGDFKTGLILGLCMFKPTIILTLPFFLYLWKDTKRTPWLMGLAIGIFVNWIYFGILFLIDPTLISPWIMNMLGLYADNTTKSSIWGLHYAWLWTSILACYRKFKQDRFLQTFKAAPKVVILWQKSLA